MPFRSLLLSKKHDQSQTEQASTTGSHDDSSKTGSVDVGKTTHAIAKHFIHAKPNSEFLTWMEHKLATVGYGRDNTLAAFSFCCDETNRELERDLSEKYGDAFCLNGLAGFPFGGATALGAMQAHIPDNGHCVIVYGPHVGVDRDGQVGTVNRRAKSNGGACCGSAVAACHQVRAVTHGHAKLATEQFSAEMLDWQQAMVCKLLLPHADRVLHATDSMVELPYALFAAQQDMWQQLTQKSAAHGGKVALLGGIQINTPAECEDFFLPLQFDLLDDKGHVVENLL